MTMKTLLAAPLLLAGSVLFLGAAGAEAQTATNLICKGCVGKKDLEKDAIRSKHLKDGAVKPKDLNKSAKPGAASNVYTDSQTNFNDTTGVTVQSDTIEVAYDGYLVVVASWRWVLNTNEGSDCTVTLDSTTYDNANRNRGYNANAALLYPPGSTTAMFEDVTAGEHIVRLICKTDAAFTVGVQFRNLTTMYFPAMM